MGLPEPSDQRIAVVTGASAGIGVAIARELAARGHALALVARRAERLESLAADLRSEHGVEADAVVCDLGDPSSRGELVQRLEGTGRAVEILVNNAGFGSTGDFATTDTDRMLMMVRLNVEAVVDLTGRLLPGMSRRGRGVVVNVASTAAFQPIPGNAVYAASKAFVLSFSESLHTELRGSGVTVTAVCPGPVRTEFTEAAGLGDVEGRTPDVIWMSAEDVARQAVEAAERGRRVVVPGLLNRAGAIAGQHSPRALALPIAERLWKNA